MYIIKEDLECQLNELICKDTILMVLCALAQSTYSHRISAWDGAYEVRNVRNKYIPRCELHLMNLIEDISHI